MRRFRVCVFVFRSFCLALGTHAQAKVSCSNCRLSAVVMSLLCGQLVRWPFRREKQRPTRQIDPLDLSAVIHIVCMTSHGMRHSGRCNGPSIAKVELAVSDFTITTSYSELKNHNLSYVVESMEPCSSALAMTSVSRLSVHGMFGTFRPTRDWSRCYVECAFCPLGFLFLGHNERCQIYYGSVENCCRAFATSYRTELCNQCV